MNGLNRLNALIGDVLPVSPLMSSSYHPRYRQTLSTNIAISHELEERTYPQILRGYLYLRFLVLDKSSLPLFRALTLADVAPTSL